MKTKKTFVLDTNVPLHDPDCLFKFAEHDIVVSTTLLEELDRYKKGNEEVNYNARKFIRYLDKLRQESSVSFSNEDGISLGDDKGNLFVFVSSVISDEIKTVFADDINDNRILSTVIEIRKKSENNVILITKDINLRIKSDIIGIISEDYQNDKVNYDNVLGRSSKIKYSSEAIQTLYDDGIVVVNNDLLESQISDIHNNQNFILSDDEKKTALARYSEGNFNLIRRQKGLGNISPKNSEQVFALDALLNPEIKLVCLSGKAGTGKTLLSIIAALNLIQAKEHSQIILSAAVVPVGNKEIGFLPGTAEEKVSPYMQGLFDNLAFIKRQNKSDYLFIEQLQSNESFVIQPLASIRGRSLNDVYFIIDESQNLTPHEVKTIVTRAGQNTKIVFNGDVSQIDAPYLDIYSNGFSHLIHKMTGQKLFAHILLEKGERSDLAELAASIL